MPPTFLNPAELARCLNVSRETILTCGAQDKIPCIRDGRRRVLFNLDSVLKALRETKGGPHASN